MFSISGKRAFITGGSNGIGLEVARLFVEHGARVVIADIADGSEIAEEIGASYRFCDVGDEESVRQSLNESCDRLGGKLDVVVLNAGIGDVGDTIENTSRELLERMTRINQWGVFYGLKHAPGFMNDGGSIICTSSQGALFNVPGTGVYSAGKLAMISMTQMSALELGGRGIRVNSVCPAFVSTKLGNTPEEQAMAAKMTALGRHSATREDVAGVYLFLAAPASRYVTGQAISVDGGLSLGVTATVLEMVTGAAHTPGAT